MPKVFVSQGAGAVVVVFSQDHCPPHVHAKNHGDGWTARVSFSFMTDDVRLISMTPIRNTPPRPLVNGLMREVGDALPRCRGIWWSVQGTTCLENKWVVASRTGLTVLPGRRADAAQVREAAYDSEKGWLQVLLHDDSRHMMQAGQGFEP